MRFRVRSLVGPLVCFLAIPPVISPVISPAEPSWLSLRLIPPVEPLGEFSGDLSGLILRLIPPGKTLSLSRQTGQKNG